MWKKNPQVEIENLLCQCFRTLVLNHFWFQILTCVDFAFSRLGVFCLKQNNAVFGCHVFQTMRFSTWTQPASHWNTWNWRSVKCSCRCLAPTTPAWWEQESTETSWWTFSIVWWLLWRCPRDTWRWVVVSGGGMFVLESVVVLVWQLFSIYGWVVWQNDLGGDCLDGPVSGVHVVCKRMEIASHMMWWCVTLIANVVYDDDC